MIRIVEQRRRARLLVASASVVAFSFVGGSADAAFPATMAASSSLPMTVIPTSTRSRLRAAASRSSSTEERIRRGRRMQPRSRSQIALRIQRQRSSRCGPTDHASGG